MTVLMSDVAPTFDSGVERYRAGAYAEAEAIFARLRAAQEKTREEAQGTGDGTDAATLRMLGLARFRLGRLEPALALIEAALEAAPADPETQLHYGLVLHAAGRHAEAAAQFRSSAKLLPLDPAPHLNLSAALLALGDAAGAVRAAKHARRRDANLPQVHYMLGLALMAADRLDDAIRAFAAALRLDPKLADALGQYRRHLLSAERYRRRQDRDARALAVAPGHVGAASNLGAFLRLTGQTEASEKLLNDVLEQNPDAAEVRVNQAAASALGRAAAGGSRTARRETRPGRSAPCPTLADAALAGAVAESGGRPRRARSIPRLGGVPPEMEPLMLWRRVLLALAANDAARLGRTPRDGAGPDDGSPCSRASDHGAFRSRALLERTA